jgi:hypothetical protein
MTDAPHRERRWIILADDGRHVTVGRHTDPTEEEIERAGAGLRAISAGGWLAVLEGAYYHHGTVSLMMVREIAPARCEWDAAVNAFRQIRCRSIDTPAP